MILRLRNGSKGKMLPNRNQINSNISLKTPITLGTKLIHHFTLLGENTKEQK